MSRRLSSGPPAAAVPPASAEAPESILDSQERESELFDSLLQRVAGVDVPNPGSPPPAAGSVLGGKYGIEAPLGRGGMGLVFRARHLMTGRAVAVKWMLPRQDMEQSRDRFTREAQAIGRIRHPNVVDIYDVESTDAAAYLVMELLEGETLRARLKRGRLGITEVVDIAVPLLDALRVAHRQGVIHRDLKPENIFLSKSEAGEMIPKVLDFGTSTLAERAHVGNGETLTRTGQFVGTPLYTALERLRENQPFDHRVDIYSMGVILYEALTGRLPFAAKSISELTFQLATADPIPARTHRPDLPAALERVVMQALARDPAARPADAESFAHALVAACRGGAIASVPPAAPRPSLAPPERRARSRVLLLSAVAMTALVAGAIWPSKKDRLHIVDRASPAVAAGPAVPRSTAVPKDRQSAPTAERAEPVLAERSVPSGGGSPSPAARAKPLASPAPIQKGPRAPSSHSDEASANASATLSVVVLPYGTVWLDARKIGASPITVAVGAGTHLVAAGRDTPEQQSQVTLASGESHRVVLSLSEVDSRRY